MQAQTICYEVLVEATSKAVADDFVAWMRDEHGADMLAEPGCLSYRVLRRSDTCVVCEYDYRDRAALDHYIEHRAPLLRAKGTALFGGKVQITRNILPIVVTGVRSHP